MEIPVSTARGFRSGSPVWLLLAFGLIGGHPAAGQTVFSTRDFLFTLQFRPGQDIVPDPNGTPMVVHSTGIYVAGAFQISGIGAQALLRRYDLAGNEVWTHTVPAEGGAFPAALAADGAGIYLAGAVGFGRTELFLRKYDQDGNLLWVRQIRFPNGGYHMAGGMATDASGLYLSAWDGLTLGMLRKYSPAGEELWTRTLNVRSLRGLAVANGIHIAGTNDGGGFVSTYLATGEAVRAQQLETSATETVVPAALVADSTGLYVAGSVYRKAAAGGITYLPESGEAFLRKFESGAEGWVRRFGTSSAFGVVSMGLDASGIYVTGWTQRALPGQCWAGNTDVFARKYDLSGVEQWTRQFGTSEFDFSGTLAVDSTGVYLSGGIRGGLARGTLFVSKLPKTQTVANDARPQISYECVVNAASYTGGGVAPGEIVTIFGQAMGPAELASWRLGPDGRLPTTLAGTTIRFNGVAAPILYVSASQSSVIIPNAVSSKPAVTIEVEYRGMRSDPLTLPVLQARPGIFTTAASGIGQGAILNQDGTLNSSANPAARGSTIVLYITGAGLTDPAVADGEILSGVSPKPLAPVSVWFDDPSEEGTISPTEVVFAGGISQSVAGLLQVNSVVPTWAKVGNAISIYVNSGTFAEGGVTVAIK
jgi:uncharacterized protein (TIGR03437 family)